MPGGGRRLRDISPQRVIKAFERLGYEIARVRGSHYVLKHSTRPTVSIPRHRVVKVGLLLSKIKAAGISPEEFEELL
ncbi:MAG: type II toxin-antitoxin system HicA family toxin [Chloroflexi bacterium]|nr:type II toxin-antitoxin system HicA family toxin [Chloroflexota bacterium]